MTIDQARRTHLMTELHGPKCRCGRTKRAKRTFCLACFRLLSPEMQKALFETKIGLGYEDLYDQCISALDAPAAE